MGTEGLRLHDSGTPRVATTHEGSQRSVDDRELRLLVEVCGWDEVTGEESRTDETIDVHDKFSVDFLINSRPSTPKSGLFRPRFSSPI